MHRTTGRGDTADKKAADEHKEGAVTWVAVLQGSLRNWHGDGRRVLQKCFVPIRPCCWDFLAVVCLGVPGGRRGLGCCTLLKTTGIGCCISIFK